MLRDDTEVHYYVSGFQHADFARGARFDDPACGIAWRDPVRVISTRDRSCPDSQP